MSTPRFKYALLIDDNEINNFMQDELIKGSGFAENTAVKQSAMDALDYLHKEVHDSNVPEVIFLDIRMPILDGFAFLDEFKKLPAFITGKSKIVILTSSLEEQDHKRALSYPFVVDYVVKPLTLENLDHLKV